MGAALSGLLLGALCAGASQACSDSQRTFGTEGGDGGSSDTGGTGAGEPGDATEGGSGAAATGGGGPPSTSGGEAGEGGGGLQPAAGGGQGGAAACDTAESSCEGNAVVTCSADGWSKVECDGSKPICRDAACTTPASCQGLPATCGATGDRSCCESPIVTGGYFFRSYDGVSAGYQDKSFPASVSSFRLDAFEISVGRFRKFVAAWVDGWRPASGAGKHAHLNAGSGIALAGGGYELGWSNEWLVAQSATYAGIPNTLVDWDSALAAGTWTATVGAQDSLPITNLTWYESYAFCIWDDGFLPTEAEWNYAAAGGDQQRPYPWGTAAPGNDTSLANHNCFYGDGTCDPADSIAPVGEASAGAGRYGHLDLAGNVREWILDFNADYEESCTDCAQLSFEYYRGYRGGSFYDSPTDILASHREQYPPNQRSARVGARCARRP